MFSFFKKLSTKEVNDCFERLWKASDMPGFPKRERRNYDNFQVSPYNTLKKDCCAHTMHVNCGKWRLHFNAYYYVKKKEVHFTVWYINLTITNPELQKALKEACKDFTFGFLPSAVTIGTEEFPVKKIEDVEKAFQTFKTRWTTSGLFEFLDRYKTNDELKKGS
jgi:hypothetical protein